MNTKTITITEYDRQRFISALCSAMAINFKHFLEPQPVVFLALGTYIQHTKDEGTLKALNDFINAVRAVNSYAISLEGNKGSYSDLVEFINSIPLADEPRE